MQNQKTGFMLIFCVRLLLNMIPMFSDPVMAPINSALAATGIGIIGVVLLDALESWTDMLLLLCGLKVGMVKLKSNLSDPKKWIELGNAFKEAMTNHVGSQARSGSGKISKNEETGEYSGSHYNTNSALDNAIAKVGENTKQKPFGNSILDGLNSYDYNEYLCMLILLFPNKMKMKRISDLIQMKGMEKDLSFRLSNCYTYIGSEITYTYDPVLPMFVDGYDNKRRYTTHQYNGY